MSCTYDDSGDCNGNDTYSDDSASIATMWIIVIVIVIAKATFWILVCFYCRRRRRRMYVVSQAQVQVTSSSSLSSTTHAYPQSAAAPAILVAQPVSRSQGFGVNTMAPPGYSAHAPGSTPGKAAAPHSPAAYPGTTIPSAPEEEPVVSDRVGLLTDY